MIEELNAEQVAGLAVVREEWLAHGLSTEPADRPEAEQGVREAYAAADLPAPEHMIWLDSPMAGAIAAARFAASGDEIPDLTKDVPVSPEQIQEQLYRCVYAQHDAGWLSFYDFFQRYCGLEEVIKPINGLARVAKSAGWWWPFTNAAILTERPKLLRRNPQNRLHCEDGPALQYPDGWGIWAWNGVRVPRDLIEEGWTTERILREENQEIRRCAIERIGWDTFISQSDLKMVGNPVPDPGNPGCELELYDVPERIYGERIRVLLCTNGTVERDGTRRRFGITVPMSARTPIEAAAWSYGLETEQYKGLARRS